MVIRVTRTLWNQCLFKLVELNGEKDLSLKEVDRLAVLVAKEVREDYSNLIEDIVSKTKNSFVDDLPF